MIKRKNSLPLENYSVKFSLLIIRIPKSVEEQVLGMAFIPGKVLLFLFLPLSHAVQLSVLKNRTILNVFF